MIKDYINKIGLFLSLALSGGLLAFAFSIKSLPPQGCPQLNYSAIYAQAPGLNPKVLQLAYEAYQKACEQNIVKNKDVLTIIDYSKPSTERRLWIIDLKDSKVIVKTHVAHGKDSGGNYATHFSDDSQSYESCIGAFLTGGTYYGKNGYSMRLNGLEKGVNDKAYQREIVMHSAWYVSRDFAKTYGRLGRSWGCPALNKNVYRQVINDIKNGSVLFIYYPDSHWLRTSAYLH